MKKSLIITSFALLALIGFQAQASDSTQIETSVSTSSSYTNYDGIEGMPPSFGQTLRAQREQFKQDLENKKQEIQARVEQKRQELEAFRESLGQRISSVKEEGNDKIREMREENKKEIMEKRDEMKDKLADFRKEMEVRRLELKNKVAEKVSFRFEAAIERLTKLSDRIQSRIDKIKAAGGDVVSAQAALDKANADITLAKTKASEITLVDATNPTTIKANIDAIKAVKDAFVAVQKDLEQAVSLIKSAQVNINAAVEVNSSTTGSTTGASTNQ